MSNPSLSAFNKAIKGKYGIAECCRVCVAAKRRALEITPKERARKILVSRRWRETNPGIHAARQRQYRSGRRTNVTRDPIKERCRKFIAHAIENGTLVRPKTCSCCSNSGVRIEAHHDDYAKPFEVKWLCSRCHGKQHRLDIQAIDSSLDGHRVRVIVERMGE